MQLRMEGKVGPNSIEEENIRNLSAMKQFPDLLQSELVKEAISAFHEEGEPLEPSLEAIVPRGKGRGYFIVRDEDLGLFDAICSGLQAAAGAGFFLLNSSLSPAAIAPITAIIISTFKVLRRVIQKGTVIDSAQVQIMLALRKRGPMTVSELMKWLNKTIGTNEINWTIPKVLQILSSLKSVRLADGTIASLVAKTDDGKWGICGNF